MNSHNNLNRLIVVGTSAGGPDALSTLVAGLAADIPAAILVVQHLSPASPRVLPRMLAQAGALEAALAQDGQPLAAGQLLLAPPDRHLLVVSNDGEGPHVHVTRGPRENRSRPSIDVLFRSASVAYNSRTVGVLLTGMLDDGTVGLQAVSRCGGVTVVQEPAEAAYPEMVESALAATDVDYRLPVAEIGLLLDRLAREPLPAPAPVPEPLRLEVSVNLRADSSLEQMNRLGETSFFSCPACGGRLWQTSAKEPGHYICEVGHSYNSDTLLDGMDSEIERSLWVALRTLEERARMLQRMAQDERAKGREWAAGDYEARAAETQADAQNIRRFLMK